MKVFGVTGWKNAGKTGLMERLVADISERGFSVSTLKHAHHNFDVDQPGRDSYRHRDAGAQQVLLSSGKRWALMTELRDVPEPTLDDLLGQMAPADLILIEGWKREPHPKVEAWRKDAANPLIAPNDPTIVAVASDTVLDVGGPQFHLDDTVAIADFILGQVGLPMAPPRIDRVIAIDWSSDSKRGPAKPKSDAIYMCDMTSQGAGETTYHRTRNDVFDVLCGKLDQVVSQRQRVVLGFDFAFGYPAGFAACLTGEPTARSVWEWMDTHIQDGPDNANNRFEVAGQINQMFEGEGPFWNHHHQHKFQGLSRFKPGYMPSGLQDRRFVETMVPKAQTTWKLYTPGSVGSQVLMGMPYLHKLARRYVDNIQFWPFDAMEDCAITCVEIYPSLYPLPDYQVGEAEVYENKDARQVRAVCDAILSAAGSIDFLQRPDVPDETLIEEGWIFGVPSGGGKS